LLIVLLPLDTSVLVMFSDASYITENFLRKY
jgi:hypothetical protein